MVFLIEHCDDILKGSSFPIEVVFCLCSVFFSIRCLNHIPNFLELYWLLLFLVVVELRTLFLLARVFGLHSARTALICAIFIHLVHLALQLEEVGGFLATLCPSFLNGRIVLIGLLLRWIVVCLHVEALFIFILHVGGRAGLEQAIRGRNVVQQVSLL